jgi:hypothetical protein
MKERSMTPDDLRALADALRPMAAAPCFDGIDIPGTVAFLRQCAEQRPDGWQLVPVEPTEAMKSAGGHVNSEWLNDDAPLCESRYAMSMDGVWSAMLAAAPAAPPAEPRLREPCIGNDPACPCQDGDACHYRDTATTKAWPIPQAEPKRGINWQPIETAPRDNKRPLLLASFDDRGVLSNVDFNGSWECESESWERPQEYYFWDSANGMADEPTHWAYQPEGFAQLTKEPAVPQAEQWSGYDEGHRAGYALAQAEREPLSEPTEAQIEARDALLDFISENGTASEGVQHYLDRYVSAALAAKEQK